MRQLIPLILLALAATACQQPDTPADTPPAPPVDERLVLTRVKALAEEGRCDEALSLILYDDEADQTAAPKPGSFEDGCSFLSVLGTDERSVEAMDSAGVRFTVDEELLEANELVGRVRATLFFVDGAEVQESPFEYRIIEDEGTWRMVMPS